MKGKNFSMLIAVLLGLLLLYVCNSCYTESKAIKQAEKAINKKPLAVLPIFRDKFPCITTKSDTTIINTDTTIWVDCPDTASEKDYFTVHDTIIKKVNNVITKTIKVPVTLPVKTMYITKEVEDLSRIAEMGIKLNEQKHINKKQGESLAFYKKGYFIAISLLLILAVIFGIRLYSKLTIKKLLP